MFPKPEKVANFIFLLNFKSHFIYRYTVSGRSGVYLGRELLWEKKLKWEGVKLNKINMQIAKNMFIAYRCIEISIQNRSVPAEGVVLIFNVRCVILLGIC